MRAERVDNTIMLLSTDWFIPYWLVLGINLDEQKKLLLQKGCRGIVDKIVFGAKEYWLANFSSERIVGTYEMLKVLLQNCGINEFANSRITALTVGAESSSIDDSTGWLLISITEQLLSDTLPTGEKLNPAIKQILGRAWGEWKRSDFADIDFVKICLDSTSPWDKHIKSLTPDLPMSLADYLVSLRGHAKSELLWAVINADLTKDQRHELLLWYRRVGQLMTGEQLMLPTE
jgi:hypothetical protein